MSSLKQFIKSYWDYFLDLEDQFIETKRFVEFDKANDKTYSIEYLKLYQAVCSEIDVVGKEIAIANNSGFKISKRTTIKNWGYEIQKKFPGLKDVIVSFNDERYIQPFKNWEYEQSKSVNKNGKTQNNLKIKGDKEAIVWWRNYNDIKHRRIGLIEGTKNFQLANQSNLIQAFAALFILEMLYIETFPESEWYDIGNSKLFALAT